MYGCAARRDRAPDSRLGVTFVPSWKHIDWGKADKHREAIPQIHATALRFDPSHVLPLVGSLSHWRDGARTAGTQRPI